MKRRGRRLFGSLVPCAFALVTLVVACSSRVTGIRYVPSSLLAPIRGSHVLVRAYGAAGTLDFCGDYPVDETQAPGDAIALVTHESALTFAPRGKLDGPVRIVTELYDQSPFDVCSGKTSPGLLVRKVSILPYVEGSLVPLRTVFDASCLRVTTCDEATETCEAGRCRPAGTSVASGSVATGPCFDIGACPTLERAVQRGGGDACAFAVPKPTSRGYVALTFRLPDPAGGDVGSFAAVLSPSEYTLDPTGDIRLGDRLCDLVNSGNVTNVYFGFECAPPEPSAALCPTNAPFDDDSPLGRVLVGGQGPSRSDDAASEARTDGTLPDGTGIDGSADSARDASGEGGTGVPDGSDAGPSGDDGGRDGSSTSDGGSDGAAADGSDGSIVPPEDGVVQCGPASTCEIATDVCCVTGPGEFDRTCGPKATSTCPGRYECDDGTDCGGGSNVCCSISEPASGNGFRGACMSPNDCDREGGDVLCSLTDVSCPTGKSCAFGGSRPPGAASGVCVTAAATGQIVCFGGPSCSVGPSGCCKSSRTCEPTSSSCVDMLRCDDASDCGLAPPGSICCFDPLLATSTCTSPFSCEMSGFRVLCSADDSTCPGVQRCRRTSRIDFGTYECTP